MLHIAWYVLLAIAVILFVAGYFVGRNNSDFTDKILEETSKKSDELKKEIKDQLEDIKKKVDK